MATETDVSWALENISHVTNFLKFGLYEEHLCEESENERQICIALLDEVVQRFEKKENGQWAVYVKMNGGMPTPDTSQHRFNAERYSYIINEQTPKENNHLVNSSMEPCGKESVSPYLGRSQEDIYVEMNGNALNMDVCPESSNIVDSNGDKFQCSYVNASMLNAARTGVNTEDYGANGSKISAQEPQEKLFLSASDIEDKWRKLSVEQETGSQFQQEAISALKSLKKQSSRYVKKDSFCFGYLQRKKKKLIGHRWEKIYAIIKKNVMFLYKSEFEEKSMEIIILNGYDVSAVEEKGKEAGFQLSPVSILESEDGRSRPSHRFRCDSADFEIWQKALLLPERQKKKDTEMAWLKVAPMFDCSVNDEDLRVSNGAACSRESSPRLRSHTHLTNTPAKSIEVSQRERSHTDFSDNNLSTDIREYSRFESYRSPCPLPN